MPLFKKKPVVIEAKQFTDNGSAMQIMEWMGYPSVDLRIDPGTGLAYELDILTLEDGKDSRAKHVASLGDWIIRGVQGEFYPCKPDIFEQTYEAA
jgi:hypothetical protein